MALVVKNLPAMQVDIRDPGSVPGPGRYPEEGNGNPFQYSCLENPMDRGAWWAAVHGVAQSGTRLKRLSTHAQHNKLLYNYYMLFFFTKKPGRFKLILFYFLLLIC